MSPSISLLTAEFTDQAIESEYRRRNAQVNIRHARLGLTLWVVLLLLFIYSDYINLGLTTGFYMLTAMRLGVSAAVMVFIVIVGRYPALIMNGYGVTGLLILGWSGFFMVFFLFPQDQLPWIIAMVMAMLIGQHVFIPNRVVLGAAVSFYAICGALFSVQWVAGTESGRLTELGFMLLVPSATGLFVAHRFQTAHRRAFALLLKTEITNEELKREVNARRELETELRRQADTDPLTGLKNRRSYEAIFRQEINRVRRYGGALSLLVLDIDNFKNVNDFFGHSAGDEALQKVAGICSGQLRETDIIGRLGGEEFVVMMPGTALHEAASVAERLRKKISEMDIETDYGNFRLTVTIGIAEFGPEDKGIEYLVRRADEALYRGKEDGRNRVSFVAN